MTGNELAEACAAVRDLFDAKAAVCAVVLRDELEFVACDGEAVAELLGTRLRIGEGITGYVAQAGVPVEVAPVAADERLAAHLPILQRYLPGAVLAAPVVDREDRVLGSLVVLDPSPAVVAEVAAAVGGALPVLALLAADLAEVVAQIPVPDSV